MTIRGRSRGYQGTYRNLIARLQLGLLAQLLDAANDLAGNALVDHLLCRGHFTVKNEC